MAVDKKISQLASGAPAQAGDEYVVARSGANFKLTLTNIAASMPPIGATTPNTGSFTSLTNSGNLTFSSTAQRITGDMSNATHANRLSFQSSTTNGATTPFLLPNGTSQISGIVAANASDPTNCSFGQLRVNGTSSVDIISSILGTGTYLPMTFATGGSERMRLDTSGNVGIGTASPSTGVHLNRASGNTYYRAQNGTANADFGVDSAGTGIVWNNSNYPLAFGTNNTERMRIDSSGNVGIGGTAAATAKVQVLGTLPSSGTLSFAYHTTATIPSSTTGAAVAYHSKLTTDAASFTLGTLAHILVDPAAKGAGSTITNQMGFYAESTLTGATNNYGFYSNIASAANRWNFYAAGTADNYFAGNVLINRTTTVGNAKFAFNASSTSNSDYAIWIGDSGGTRLFGIDNAGGFSTGVAGNSPYNSTTGNAANVVVDANGVLQRSTSSLRYKSDVADASHGLADVLKLRSVTYKGKNDGNKVFGGLIAEEVHDAGLTEFVAYDKEGRPDALHYGNMVALLVKAVQELSAKVAALEAK